jgi:hypothetical protein
MTSPDQHDDGTGPARDLPPAPWILLDRTSTGQAARVLEWLGQWLLSGPSRATEACARALSAGEADAEEVAYWLDALSGGLINRIEEADSWS